MTKPKGQRKQFEVGKSYYRELPSNPSSGVGTELYKLFQICEVIKRTKHFVTLKEGEYPNEKIYRKKVRVENVWRSKYDDYEDSMELCRVGYYHYEIIRADQPCQEYDL